MSTLKLEKKDFLYLIIVWVMNSKTGNINDEKEKLIMSLQYAYCRISTKDQNIERQIIAVKQFAPEISDNNIFIDKKTGKVFEREQYQEMKVILEHISKANLENETVELIIEELDRLGRNSDGIKKELMWYKEHGMVLCQDLAQNKMRSSATKLLTENRPSHTFFQSR